MKSSRGEIYFIIWSCLCLCVAAEHVNVTVKGGTSIAQTDDNFICATLDWWPRNKCDFNQCPWGEAGIFNLDLDNKILANAIKAFDPLRIRVGGSLQDQIIYEVGLGFRKCPHIKKMSYGMFGFSKGCLPMCRWDQMNNLFGKTRAKITFGLNALIGRRKSTVDSTLYEGDWDYQNALDFMIYTVSKGYKIDSYEFGNELSGTGIAARVEAEQYGKDMIILKNLVAELYQDPATKPMVLGPGGFYNKTWFDKFLQSSGPNVVNGLTHHIYNLGSGADKDLIYRIQDPHFLDQVAQTYKDISSSIKEFGPWAGAWVGESGGAYTSGGKGVSHTFANGFWYLDQLGMTSTFNHKVFCRQTLIGGNYALLNTTTFIPNPDYYGALLWHRLMGKNVLQTTHNASPYLRTYGHCSKKYPGISLLLINMSNSTNYNVSIVNDINCKDSEVILQREEYHLTPEGGNIQSDVLLLNGTPLKLTKSYDIPELKPMLVNGSETIKVAADSIVFVTIKGFKAPACAR